jgi:hypothetical protein
LNNLKPELRKKILRENRTITNKKQILTSAQRQKKLLKLLDSAPAKSQKIAEKIYKKAAENTAGKISLIKIFYFKCGQKDHLKRDYLKRKK